MVLAQIYAYQNIGPFHICGDFNSRCSNDLDLIKGVDDIDARVTIGFQSNKYCSKLRLSDKQQLLYFEFKAFVVLYSLVIRGVELIR